jgi:hypothetical protein
VVLTRNVCIYIWIYFVDILGICLIDVLKRPPCNLSSWRLPLAITFKCIQFFKYLVYNPAHQSDSFTWVLYNNRKSMCQTHTCNTKLPRPLLSNLTYETSYTYVCSIFRTVLVLKRVDIGKYSFNKRHI